MNQELPAVSGESTRALVSRLQEAEKRIYPLAMVDADRYQRSVELVGRLTQFFTGAHNVEALEVARAAAMEQVRAIAGAEGIPIADLDRDAIVDAAMAQQLRFILANEAQHSIASRIEQAERDGQAWALVEEPTVSTLGFAMEQRWVDLHLASETKLVRVITPDQTSGLPLFRLELFPNGATQASIQIVVATKSQWLEEAAALRAIVEQAAAGMS